MNKPKKALGIIERILGYSVVAFFALDPGTDARIDKVERKADLNTAAIILNHPEHDSAEDERNIIIRTLDAIWIFN